MNSPAAASNPSQPPVVAIALHPNEAQQARLKALQQVFSQACNLVARAAQANRCWNRVALHHLVYRQLRESFPELGSQMACNAVYSVCRACRWAYQHPKSPFRGQIAKGGSLPLVQFAGSAPVYFDRHTLTLKGLELSLFTMEGRMQFRLNLTQAEQHRFLTQRIKEIALVSLPHFQLVFWFDPLAPHALASPSARSLSPETLAVGPLDGPAPYLTAHETEAHEA
jgi:predicted transposase